MTQSSPSSKARKQTEQLENNIDFSGLHGDFVKNAPIGAQSWFRCGGTADFLFKPADLEDLEAFLKLYDYKEPLTIIGGLANMIVRDGGVRGVTLQLGKNFADIHVMNDYYISAECGALNGSVAAAAVKAGIGGFEFLSGIPGTLGGALRMNAGAYGTEIRDVLVGVVALDRYGALHRLTLDEMYMSYRHCGAAHDLIFVRAILKGEAEDYLTVKARITAIKARRNETQPIKDKTGGSTFANPAPNALALAGLPEDMRAWQVVEKLGGRGMSIGGAQMSEKHCNFMINTGDATAQDLEMLGDTLIARARDDLGLELRWEIRRVGQALEAM